MKNEIVIYQSKGGQTFPVRLEDENVWLNRQEIAKLFGRDVKTVGKHIHNALKEELVGIPVVAKFATTAADGKTYQVEFYGLDMILSVGYRVKSPEGVYFRRWANSVLRQHIVQGYSIDKQRLQALGTAIEILKRVEAKLDAGQVLSVVGQYTVALDLLDGYDHQTIAKPKGKAKCAIITYEQCRKLIDSMKFAGISDLFGKEKDDSFKGSIGAIYQTFDGKDVYPSAEEKSANLLYFIVKDHSFSDGNKRIGAAVFLYFLYRCKLLLRKDGFKRIADHTLVALTIMIAESKPTEREMMINLVMNFLKG